jgi:hypothetical protein
LRGGAVLQGPGLKDLNATIVFTVVLDRLGVVDDGPWAEAPSIPSPEGKCLFGCVCVYCVMCSAGPAPREVEESHRPLLERAHHLGSTR